MTATPSVSPLRLLLALLLAASALGAVQMEARAERGEDHAKVIAARASVRAPANRGLPAAPDLAAALPLSAPSLAPAPLVAAPELPAAPGVRPARGGPAVARARGPPR